jgi:hypothetical protein
MLEASNALEVEHQLHSHRRYAPQRIAGRPIALPVDPRIATLAQAHCRIGAQHQPSFLPRKAVLDPPAAVAFGGNEQV